MTDSLGTLLGSSFSMFKAKISPIFVGAVVFGLLTFGTQMYFSDTAIKTMQGNPLVNMEHLQELAERAEKGDTAALEELMEQAGVLDGSMGDEAAKEAMAIKMMKGMLPAFGMLFLVGFIITVLSSAYFLVLTVEQSASAKDAFAKLPKLALPLIGVWIWSFLRSFAWIPIIGIVFAVILGPRFVAAPVILVKEGKGVLESTKLSYDRTRGYWGKVFGNCIVAALCAWVVMMVIGFAIGMLGSSTLTVLLGTIVSYAVAAFMTVFIVKLSDTIAANQLKITK